MLLVTPVEELSGTSHKKLEQVGMRQKQIQIYFSSSIFLTDTTVIIKD